MVLPGVLGVTHRENLLVFASRRFTLERQISFLQGGDPMDPKLSASSIRIFCLCLLVVSFQGTARGGSKYGVKNLTAAEKRKIANGGTVTRVKSASMTTGGKIYRYKGKMDGNLPVLEYDGPAPQKTGSSRSRSRSNSRSRSSRTRLGAQGRSRTVGQAQVVSVPWKERVAAARAAVQGVSTAELSGQVSGTQAATTYAALERAYKTKTEIPEAVLVSSLEQTRNPKVAHALAFHLSKIESTTAREALAKYVASDSAGSEKVRPFLGPEGEPLIQAAKNHMRRREKWMEDAVMGSPGSRSQTEAITALAAEPGGDVTSLLKQLAGDQNTSIAKLAQSALEKRSTLGL